MKGLKEVLAKVEALKRDIESCPWDIPSHLRGKANYCLAGGPKTERHPSGSFCSYLGGGYKEVAPGLSILEPRKCKLEDLGGEVKVSISIDLPLENLEED